MFESTRLDEITTVLEGQTYTRMRIRPSGGQHYLRFSEAAIGPATLQHLTFRMDFEVHLEPVGAFLIGRGHAGTIRRAHGRDVTGFGPGDLFLITQPEQPFHAHSHDHDGEFALLLRETFTEITGATPVLFTGDRPVSAHAAATWHATYDYVRDEIAGLGEPLLAASAARLLAAAALHAFPNDAVREPDATDRRDAHPETLRRAITFIAENAHRDISPARIAAAAKVTVRALQLAFRRHLDITPAAYLRLARLDHAHRDLLAADPSTTTILRVARRWGFATADHFTVRYRSAYGRLPSETLHRR